VLAGRLKSAPFENPRAGLPWTRTTCTFRKDDTRLPTAKVSESEKSLVRFHSALAAYRGIGHRRPRVLPTDGSEAIDVVGPNDEPSTNTLLFRGDDFVSAVTIKVDELEGTELPRASRCDQMAIRAECHQATAEIARHGDQE
jgi:hypothetical protein